jgi:hypothetical protein
LYKTISNGNGGNVPENDIEALMKSSVACINCRDIILIADNAAAVSDMSLLSQLHQPVHIILCGVRDAINPDYLNIAWRSGGSVHIAEEDILLNTIKEGETITARGRRYKIVNGKFKMDN